jgi:hypothetical protein
MIGIVLQGCYPKGPIYYSDSDLVATNYDNGFDFNGAVYYSLPDSVVHIIDPDDNDPDVDRTYDQDILDAIEANMDAAGFVKVDIDTLVPDLIIKPAVWSATNTGVIYDYSYWGWYYPPYGGWYPYYPWGGYVYSYTYGTLLMDIVDVNGIDIEEEFIPIVWTGALNGVLSDSRSDMRKRIRDGIDQCFIQSPYLLKSE